MFPSFWATHWDLEAVGNPLARRHGSSIYSASLLQHSQLILIPMLSFSMRAIKILNLTVQANGRTCRVVVADRSTTIR